MKIHCTRPDCPKPENHVADITTPELVCQACGMPLMLPRNYLPVEPLGRGGFGATFKAIYLPLHNEGVTAYRVVKRLDIKTNDPRLVAQIKLKFREEAEVLNSLGVNSHIPVLYDYFSFTAPAFDSHAQSYPQQELNYLAQQYIQGQDLSQELQTQGRLSEEKILDVLNQILPILEFIHNQDAIHRDIKPNNIIRQGEKLFLIDFGAVKQVVEGKTNLHKSLVFGSLAYAPPEQILEREVYPSSDLYALAASCIQLLTKDPLNDIRNNDNRWNWRTKYPGIVSDHLADILDKMLKPDPQERYQSATDVITALNQVQPPPNFFIQLVRYVITSGNKPPIALILLITVIFLLNIGVFRVFFSPVSIDTISFKDPISKIEIEYPQNWQLNQADRTDTIVRIFPTNVSSYPLFPEFTISVENLAPSETLDNYREFALKHRILQPVEPETIKIAGRDAYRVVYMGEYDKNNLRFKVMEIWVSDGQKVYVLTYRAEERLYDQFLKPVEETIIKSFQFPEPNQPLWHIFSTNYVRGCFKSP